MIRIALTGLAAIAGLLGTPSHGFMPAHDNVGAAAATAAATAANGLTSVSCVTSKNCVAVGQNENANGANGGAIARTWNGSKWSVVSVKLPSGTTSSDLSTVSCKANKSATFCVAVGEYSTDKGSYALVDTWNGKSWTPSEPYTAAGTFGDLLSVSCYSAQDCLAVGPYFSSSGAAGTLSEYWNGSKWVKGNPTGTSTTAFPLLTTVSCPTAKYCLAAGTEGLSNGKSSGLAYTWNGTKFTKVAGPAVSTVTNEGTELQTMSCVSASECVTVGFAEPSSSTSTPSVSAVAYSWNGSKWATGKLPVGKGAVLSGLSCVAPKNCVAVGVTGTNLTGANSGRAAALTYNGSTWSATSVAAPAKGNASELLGDDCLSAKDCIAVGTQGSTSKLNNSTLSGFWNGSSWTLKSAG